MPTEVMRGSITLRGELTAFDEASLPLHVGYMNIKVIYEATWTDGELEKVVGKGMQLSGEEGTRKPELDAVLRQAALDARAALFASVEGAGIAGTQLALSDDDAPSNGKAPKGK